jgi:gluconolactonase
MTNGGTGPVGGNLLLINSGRGPSPPSLTLVNPDPPFNATVLLDNFFGRQFNSLNDVKVHPKSGKFFFTDVTCVPVPFRAFHVFFCSGRKVADGH